MTSERVTLISSLVGETVVEPLLTGVASSWLSMFLNVFSSLVNWFPSVAELIVWFAWIVTTPAISVISLSIYTVRRYAQIVGPTWCNA